MPHRFFIPPEWLTPPQVTFQAGVAHQIKNVLRLRPDDVVIVLDGSGRAWQVHLTQVEKRTVQGEIKAEQVISSEPQTHITLYQGTLKAQKFEWVLQKCTELGVSRFVPTICQRSIVKDRKAMTKKYGRWEQIIQEAAEQSGRGRLPTLQPPLSFRESVAQVQNQGLILMPWEQAESTNTLDTAVHVNPAQPIHLFIGPEGGFTPTEAELVTARGGTLLKLGPRILRAETASIAITAVLLYKLGNWDS